MLLTLGIPIKINKARSAHELFPDQAKALNFVEIRRKVLTRGPGACRVGSDFTGGESSSVNSCGGLIQTNGKYVLIYATTAGSWRYQSNPASAYEDSDY